MSVTVWKDGTWKSWSAADSAYAANDPDWLVNIPPRTDDLAIHLQDFANRGCHILLTNDRPDNQWALRITDGSIPNGYYAIGLSANLAEIVQRLVITKDNFVST